MNALVIMAKEPNPNEVKTRLIPPLDPNTAASLYYNFLLDKIDQVRKIKGAKFFIAYTPKKAVNFFERFAPEFSIIPQIGVDLGERLANTSNQLLNQGFKKVVLLDSDTPNLPSEYIRQALMRLGKFDLVLGPCEDGGYYLIGLKFHIPEIFRDVPWSTSQVTDFTEKKAQKLGLSISFLDSWYDVDTLDELMRLHRNLNSSSNKKNIFCYNTYRFLSKINFKKIKN